MESRKRPDGRRRTASSCERGEGFKIIKMNEPQKRIGLSLRAMAEEEERLRLQDYQRQASIATSTMGDVIKQHSNEEQN